MAFFPSRRAAKGDGWVSGGRAYEYHLASIYDTLWRFYVQGIRLGNGGILDGGFDYIGELGTYRSVPRFFDSDRLSFFATWKKDSGIVPFVFDSSLIGSRKGRIFFDPARTYREHLTVPDDWSTDYTYNPYLPRIDSASTSESPAT